MTSYMPTTPCSVTNAESDCARDKKAKDWVGTGQIWTVECLKTSKLHNLKVELISWMKVVVGPKIPLETAGFPWEFRFRIVLEWFHTTEFIQKTF